MFFDSHAHIGAPELYPEAGALLERAREAGVDGVIAVGSGYGLERNAYALALSDDHPKVWATGCAPPPLLSAKPWPPSPGRPTPSPTCRSPYVKTGGARCPKSRSITI